MLERFNKISTNSIKSVRFFHNSSFSMVGFDKLYLMLKTSQRVFVCEKITKFVLN